MGAFNSEIESDEIKKRQTNYAFWANYDVDFEGGDLTMTDILPVIFNDADITTNDFLDTAYEMHKQYPIHTTSNVIVNKTGSRMTYDGTQEILNEYYSKEYTRLKEGESK